MRLESDKEDLLEDLARVRAEKELKDPRRLRVALEDVASLQQALELSTASRAQEALAMEKRDIERQEELRVAREEVQALQMEKEAAWPTPASYPSATATNDPPPVLRGDTLSDAGRTKNKGQSDKGMGKGKGKGKGSPRKRRKGVHQTTSSTTTTATTTTTTTIAAAAAAAAAARVDGDQLVVMIPNEYPSTALTDTAPAWGDMTTTTTSTSTSTSMNAAGEPSTTVLSISDAYERRWGSTVRVRMDVDPDSGYVSVDLVCPTAMVADLVDLDLSHPPPQVVTHAGEEEEGDGDGDDHDHDHDHDRTSPTTKVDDDDDRGDRTDVEIEVRSRPMLTKQLSRRVSRLLGVDFDDSFVPDHDVAVHGPEYRPGPGRATLGEREQARALLVVEHEHDSEGN